MASNITDTFANNINQSTIMTQEFLNISDHNVTTTELENLELPQLRYDLWITILLSFAAGSTSLCTTIGNIMVVIAFILEKNIRQAGNYLIASLAVTDILIGSLSMPLYTQYLLLNEWVLGHITCDLWLSLDYTVCLVSQYTVFLITLDRFCSVKFPAKYRNWRTKRKIKFMILVSWALPTTIFFTSILGWPYMTHTERPKGSCYAMFAENKVFTVVLIIFYYWTTLAVMFVLYAGIYWAARRLHLKSKRAKDRIKRMTQTQKKAADGEASIGAVEEKELLSQTKVNNVNNNNIQTPETSLSSNAPNKNEEEGTSDNAAPITGHTDANGNLSVRKPYTLVISNSSINNSSNSSNNLSVRSSGEERKLTIESPLWKPRSSIPNSSIHWDAFTGKTHHALQNDLDLGGKNTIAEEDGMEPEIQARRSINSQSYNNNFDSCSETSDSDNKPKVIHQLSSLIANISPQRRTQKQVSRENSSRKSKNENRARKALKTITFIMGAFVVCWTPYHVLALMDSLCRKPEGEKCVNETLYEFSYWLCYMNSPLNPFCYALANQQFKKAFLKMLKGEYIRDWWKQR